MCGIAGFVSRESLTTEAMTDLVAAMTKTMWRRGPDDQHEWVDQEAGVAIGHRRLRIIDLSPTGLQPMKSHSGRYVIAFNGEIYNFKALRQQLSGVAWRGSSDTEVLLAAIDAWGLETALKRSNGMFALALCDRQDRELWLARDRIGEKPLYFGEVGGTFAFASELKPFRVLQRSLGADLAIDREALAQLLEFQYIPAPRSIFSGIRKLQPGHFVKAGEEPRAYWSLSESVETALADPFEGDEAAAIDAMEQQLLKSVESRMESDVPLGAFLSGGIDSGLLVAMAQKISSKPLRTFTIGFEGAENNEATEAAAIAKHLGTDHTEMWVGESHPLEVVPQLAEFYDEPFADASQIPTHLVSKLTREHVTVSLSGDGGDEVFGGYNRYFIAERLNQRLSKLPAGLRKAAGRAVCATPEAVWRAASAVYNGLAPGARQIKSPVEKIYKLGSLAQVDGMAEVYQDLTKSHWRVSGVVEGLEPSRGFQLPALAGGLDDAPAQMMFWDLLGYLPGDGLTKVDRASMSASLESRAPFLDHELIEFAWRLPLGMKVRGSEGKWISKQLLARYVPRELFERPKCGFETPLYRWLRGPLKDWANDLLSEDRLRREGFFEPGPIRRAWDDHQSGRGRKHYELWSVLMFQQWLDSN